MESEDFLSGDFVLKKCADNLLFLSRFLCSEEDEGFCTEPVANNQNSGPLGFYFTQKVLPSFVELKQLVWHYCCMLGCVYIYP